MSTTIIIIIINWTSRRHYHKSIYINNIWIGCNKTKWKCSKKNKKNKDVKNSPFIFNIYQSIRFGSTTTTINRKLENKKKNSFDIQLYDDDSFMCVTFNKDSGVCTWWSSNRSIIYQGQYYISDMNFFFHFRFFIW